MIDPKIHRQIVTDLINVFTPKGIGVEIGVKKAKTSSVILKNTNIAHIYLIDPWMGRPKEYSRIKKYINENFFERATILRKKSDEAVKCVSGELDFLWIDGDHSYSSVMKDLELWVPKVRSGGLIVGHDWCDKFPGVESAIRDFIELNPFAPLKNTYPGVKHEYYQEQELVNVSKFGHIWWALKI